MEYVVCLAFDGDFVVLIKKNRPAWQAGRFNGPGGKIEAGESPAQAAAREFEEETGARIAPDRWRHFATLRLADGGAVHFLTVSRPVNTRSMTDEEVGQYSLAGVYDGSIPVIPNLRWLIPLALDKDSPFAAVSE